MSVSLKEKVSEVIRKNPSKIYTVTEIAKDLGSLKEEVSARLLELCKNGDIARRPVTAEEKVKFKGHGARPQWFYFLGSEEERKVWRKKKTATSSKAPAKKEKKSLVKTKAKTTGIRKVLRAENKSTSDTFTFNFGEFKFTPTQARSLYTSLQQIFN